VVVHHGGIGMDELRSAQQSRKLSWVAAVLWRALYFPVWDQFTRPMTGSAGQDMRHATDPFSSTTTVKSASLLQSDRR
jgi:hypothetical protein